MNLRTIGFLAGLLLLIPSANAAGVYARGSLLFDGPQDVKVNTASDFRSSVKKNVGVSGAIGYKFTVARIEVELQHLNNDFQDASNSSGSAAVGGSLKRSTGYTNAYIDLPSVWGLSPYLGAGLGFAKVDLSNVNATQSGATVAQFSGSDTAFAYQAMAGIEFSIFGKATVHAGYRIAKHEDVKMREITSALIKQIQLGQDRLFEVGIAIGF